MIRKQVAVDPEPGPNGTYWFVASNETRDREGDVIRSAGWDLTAFRQNPVILFSHDASAAPIGRAIDYVVRGKELRLLVEFAPESVSTRIAEIVRLVAGGFLKAMSVGFRPITTAPLPGGGIDFQKQELLEASVCPIPANPQALIVARAIGADRDALSSWARRSVSSGDVIDIIDTPVGDILRRRGFDAGLDGIGIDLKDVAAIMPGVLRASIREALRTVVVEEVNRAVRISRGRLD